MAAIRWRKFVAFLIHSLALPPHLQSICRLQWDTPAIVRLKKTAAALLALPLFGASSVAGPTAMMLSPQDSGSGRLGEFSVPWATAGVRVAAPGQRPANADAVFFSGSDFVGIEADHKRGYVTLGVVDDVLGDGASAHRPRAPGGVSTSVFVGTTAADMAADESDAALSPRGGAVGATGAPLVPPPPTEATSDPAQTLRLSEPRAATPSVWDRIADQRASHPDQASPALSSASQSAASSATAADAPVAAGAPSSVFTGAAGPHNAGEAIARWLVAEVVAANHGFKPGQLSDAARPIDDFSVRETPASAAGSEAAPAALMGAPITTPLTPAMGASGAASDTSVIVPISAIPTPDEALGANVEIYRNPPSGTAAVGQLEMMLVTLRQLTGPQIISIAMALAGFFGLIAIWRNRRRREAVASGLES